MKRIIFLVDMNAFFIGCEMARRPELKGRPAAVAGDPKNRGGIILSPNYEARKYGIRTTMLLHEARRLCPDIVFVPPDHGFYSHMSAQVMDILSRYAPILQQNSIDEAWLDLTGCEGLFGRPREIAEKIMENIQEELDLWCSIGISENKFLAKMASEMKKPKGITELWESEVKERLWPLKVREMYGVGSQTERKLNNLNIFTIGDLARSSISLMISEFGKYGEELHNHANGIDPSPVSNGGVHDNKSISRSTTLSKDTKDMEFLKDVILGLAEEVGREARLQNYKGRVISIVVKYSDFQVITRQKSVSPTNLTKEIYETGIKLLQGNWDGNRPIRLIGIGIGGAKEDESGQISLFDVLQEKVETQREERLERALDAIKDKYGLDSIKRARLLKKVGK